MDTQHYSRDPKKRNNKQTSDDHFGASDPLYLHPNPSKSVLDPIADGRGLAPRLLLLLFSAGEMEAVENDSPGRVMDDSVFLFKFSRENGRGLAICEQWRGWKPVIIMGGWIPCHVARALRDCLPANNKTCSILEMFLRMKIWGGALIFHYVKLWTGIMNWRVECSSYEYSNFATCTLH